MSWNGCWAGRGRDGGGVGGPRRRDGAYGEVIRSPRVVTWLVATSRKPRMAEPGRRLSVAGPSMSSTKEVAAARRTPIPRDHPRGCGEHRYEPRASSRCLLTAVM